jgi:hypothetical protein
MFILNVNGEIVEVPKCFFQNDKLLNTYIWKTSYNISICDQTENENENENIMNNNIVDNHKLQLSKLYKDLGLECN